MTQVSLVAQMVKNLPPGDLPDSGIEHEGVSHTGGRFFITEPLGKPNKAILNALFIQSNAVIIWWKIELRQHW